MSELDLNRGRIIKNSLLFFLLRDSLPIGAYYTGVEYTIEDFNRDKTELIKNLIDTLEKTEGDIEELFCKKELKDNDILETFILRPLNEQFKDILKKDYQRYFKDTIPKNLRKEILERDGNRCQYCGIDLIKLEEVGFPAHIDHIKPRRSGGKHNPGNLVACCWKCNLGKRDFDLFEYDDDDDKTFLGRTPGNAR